MLNLKGKKALVTGAGQGIGLAIASRLQNQGAQVIGTTKNGNGDREFSWEMVSANFEDALALEKFSQWVREQSFDVIVNNAGTNTIAPFVDTTLTDFMRIHQVNVVAPFMICQAALPGMLQQRWGRIVNICSVFGQISKEHRAAYSSSKFALDGFTAALAAEVAQNGVLANCVSPGFIETNLTNQILGPEGIALMSKQVPARRLGKPDEVATLVGWLVSQENSFVSGQNWTIDGGFTRV